MKANRRSFVFSTLAATAGLSLPLPVSSQTLSSEEARKIAEDAYIYGYSLITTEVTRVQMTSVDKVEALRAPMNQFASVPRYPPADYRGVSAPNADTLYSVAWLDLAEPQVFSHPAMGDRFYLFEIVDLWMSALEGAPSKRTAGGAAANYLITGPNWTGTVPAGMKHIPMATRYMVILGRTYADGTNQDYEAVNKLQAQYKITPLSAWGTPYAQVRPPVNRSPGFRMTENAQAAMLAVGNDRYFGLMAKLMGGAAPPAAADAPMLARMARIGIVPGQSFDISKLDTSIQAALRDIPESALRKIEANKERLGVIVNDWVVTKGL